VTTTSADHHLMNLSHDRAGHV